MYNQRISFERTKMLEVRRTENGTEILLNPKGPHIKSRRTRMFTLAQFRELYIPDRGLWSHYFHCPKCGWERKNPKSVICRYCDIQMVEIGCPAFFKREEGGVQVLQLRADLQRKVEQEVADKLAEKEKGVIRREGKVRIFKIDL